MKKALLTVCASLAWLTFSAPAVQAGETSVPRLPPQLQQRFDPMGPPVQSMAGPGQRIVHFADTGEIGWRPVLFVGGTGTSARAFLMTGFFETLRRQLHLRMISVERNGFGDTAYDPSWTYADYAAQVRAVTDHLGIRKFAIIAISGGGPYAAHIAAAMPERLISVHMAAALANVRSGELDVCQKPLSDVAKGIALTVSNPESWWAFPPSSPTHAIPGFGERAADEGARTFFIRGQMGNATPEAAEMQRYCDGTLPDLIKVKVPLFTYYGTADPLVVPANGAWWRTHFGGPSTERNYPGEGHDVQYRHWDQILLDLAGFGDRTAVCRNGRSMAVRGRLLKQELPGLCAWSH